MKLDNKYLFVVVVSSPDGRSSSQTVLVTPTESSGGAQLTITSPSTHFNVGSRLTITGTLYATESVTAVWSVYNSLGVNISFPALTSLAKSFTSSDMLHQVLFPLRIDAGVFTGGSVYSFGLTSFPTSDTSMESFTQIVLNANSPPTGGYVSSVPTIGSALVTLFVISSLCWTADSSNFPLSFSFAYKLSATSSYLTLAATSLRAYTTSTLPAGLSSQSNALVLQGKAVDIYDASSVASASVQVLVSPRTNLSIILSSGLSRAFSSGNINLAIQTVNNVSPSEINHLLFLSHIFTFFTPFFVPICVPFYPPFCVPFFLLFQHVIEFSLSEQVASTANLVNCTTPYDCALLSRYNCLNTPGTCSSCYIGLKGTHCLFFILLLFLMPFIIFFSFVIQ